MGLLEEPEFKGLHQQVCALHDQSRLLKDLFGNADDLKLLNQCAPSAFFTIQRSLLDGVILGIWRIIKDANTESLTLTALEKQSQGETRKDLSNILAILNVKTQALVRHRNKRIGHFDFKVAKGSKQLPPVFVDDIESSLALIRQFMNLFSASNGGGQIGYESGISMGDGKSLVRILRYGAEHINAMRGIVRKKDDEQQSSA